jgi:diketogulonate reductase-like aldo/keto reductase
MILEEAFTLSNGVAIPKLGLGTWRIEDGAAAQVVRNAAEIGYRHFDTAQAYANEHGVGEGLRASGIACGATIWVRRRRRSRMTF